MDASPIREVRATGVDVLSERIDIANARIELSSGLVASLTASRISAEPTRKLRIFGRNHYCSIDYRDQEIKGYGLEEIGGERRIRPRDVEVERVEPLAAELEAFLAVCRGEDVAYADGSSGRRALATALEVRRAIG